MAWACRPVSRKINASVAQVSRFQKKYPCSRVAGLMKRRPFHDT